MLDRGPLGGSESYTAPGALAGLAFSVGRGDNRARTGLRALVLAEPPLLSSFHPFAALLKGGAADWLEFDRPMWLTRAPGSADLLGGPAEMAGSLTASLALGRAVWCAIQNREDDEIRIRILRTPAQGGNLEWVGKISTIYTKKGPPRSLAVLREQFEQDGAPWMMKMMAVMIGLRRTHQLNTPKVGFTLVVWSRLPGEYGWGREAAKATSLGLAFKASTGLDKKRVDGIRVARAITYGYQEVLGERMQWTPALTSGVARAGCLLSIEHGMDPIMQWAVLPDHVSVAVVDTGLGETVPAEARTAARVGAYMALSHLNRGLVKAKVKVRGGWGQVTPAEFEGGLRNHVPTKETGADFKAAFPEMDDQPWWPFIEDGHAYRLRAIAEHHVRESGRTRRFFESLHEYARSRREDQLVEAGRAMNSSHRSLQEKCSLSNETVQELVDEIRAGGRKAGWFGARLAEAGAGPLVCVLAHASALDNLRKLVREFGERHGVRTLVQTEVGQGGVLTGWWEGVLEPVSVDEPGAGEPAPTKA